MESYLVFLVVGLGAGAVYAALALGLVVVHKGTGIVNFAQGAMALWAVYVCDEIRRTGDLVLPVGRLHVGTALAVAIACGLLTAALLGLLVHVLVFRPLRDAPPLAKVVASVGLMLTIQAGVVLRFGSDPRVVSPILPNDAVRIGGVTFPADRLYLAAIVLLLGLAFWAWFRFARSGLATRAASENEVGAALSGFSPDRLAATTWVLASTSTALVAILASPAMGLSPTALTLAVVPALAVALVARLRSLAIVVVAGLAMGAVQSELTFLTTRDWWPGWARVGVVDVLPLVVIVAALFAFGRKLPTRDMGVADRLPDVLRPRNRPGVVVLLLAAGTVAILLTSGSYRFGIVTSMIMAVIALSLVLLTGFVGQISLAQAAFAGIGGFVLAQVVQDAGVPFPFSIVLAGAAASVVGVVVGLPSLRIRGAQLAVVTLAAAVAIEQFVFRNRSLAPPDGMHIDDASLLGVDLGVRSGVDLVRTPFALMVLAVLALVALAVANLARGATGRAFLAVRSNERAAAAAGIGISSTKLLAFGLSSFVAGLGGALIGLSRGQLSPESFTVMTNLSLLAFAYLGGITSVGGALVAGTMAPLGVGYVLLDRTIELGGYYQLFAGVLLLLTVVLNPDGVAGKTRRDVARLTARWRAARTDRLPVTHGT